MNIDSLLQSKTPPKELPIDAIFSLTEKLPLQKIYLHNIHVMVESPAEGFAVEAQNGGLLLTNMGKNITARADIPDLQFQMKDLGHFAGSLDSHLYLTRQSLRILQLGVHLDQSEFIVHGELTPFKDLSIKPAGVLSLSAKISLHDIFNEILKVRPSLKLPEFSGELSTDAEAHFNGFDDFKGKADITTQAVTMGKFELGDAHVLGEFKNRLISLSEVSIKHPAGSATLTKSQIELARDFDFKAHLHLEELDLQKLFQALDLDNIPAGAIAHGEIPCSGKIRPSFVLNCEGATLSAKDIWVKSENNSKGHALLNLQNFSGKGRMQLTPQLLSYSADLALGDSTGSSDGVIDLEKGFKINYKAKNLNF
ncbi:MAG TPA: hypothetical protein VN132_03175, partial [Bdellovibrio sp.]|nr:hypothetical protein [Bdellovibrio sp.]